MTAAAPWSVKGIDPKAREVAKELARRSGMTLGEWLNRIILEDDMPEDVTSEEHITARPTRSLGLAAYEAPRSYMSSSPFAAKPVQDPADPTGRAQGDELARIAKALDRLTDRIEASETRTGLAISGVEHSVRHAMARIETAEREHMAVATRFDAAAEQLAAEQARVSGRLNHVEDELSGPRSIEVLRALESAVTRVATNAADNDARMQASFAGLEARLAQLEASEDPAHLIEEAVSRLAQRLADAEARTGDALHGLRDSLQQLDQRMYAADTSVRGDMDSRFAALADDLGRQVAENRADVAQRLAAAGTGEIEHRLGRVEEDMSAAEQRSARAIEAMGREVLTMAESLNRRVATAEQHSADAIEQVGGEMSRIADAVEMRLAHTDERHAEALERLSSEVGRITDRLTDRIQESERRAAQAIDDVGEQVAKVTERIEQRHERAASDLAERIRQSEDRTRQMLEAAAAKAEGPASTPDLAAWAPSLEPQAEARPAVYGPVQAHEPSEPDLPEGAAVFGAELLARAEPLNQPALDPGNPAFSDEDFAHVDAFAPADDRFEPIDEADGEADRRIDVAWRPDPVSASPELSTREVIEQARAAARAAAASPRPKAVHASDRRQRQARGGLFGFRSGPASTWQTALMVAGSAAFLSVGAAGVVLIEGPGAPRSLHDVLTFKDPPRAAVALSEPEETPAASPAPMDPKAFLQQMEAAGAPRVGGPTETASATAKPSTDPLNSEYSKVVASVGQKEPGALTKLKAIADKSYTPAQIFLARLYETGQSGVTQNLAEARRWTMRAADAGDPSAMHNLALYYFRGEGGKADPAAAAQWFTKAAQHGVVDSQYNLGLLYQSGSGVPRDLIQAYKWFTIAANAGDTEARASAIDLQAKLSPAQISQAETQVGAFQPGAAAPGASTAAAAAVPASATAPSAVKTVAEVGPSAPAVASSQRILNRLGYYKGRPDGTASRDLALAVSSYQRDQGLMVTGALDAATMSRLAVFAR